MLRTRPRGRRRIASRRRLSLAALDAAAVLGLPSAVATAAPDGARALTANQLGITHHHHAGTAVDFSPA